MLGRRQVPPVRWRGARTVVNRAHYAAFYAVLALLQTIGKTPRKHKGALTLFDTEFIRTGLLSKELSGALHELFDARQIDRGFCNTVESR